MSSEQVKDLVAKKNACCMLFVGFDYSHIHIIYIYICILPYVCSRDMLQLFGEGLIGSFGNMFQIHTECIYNCKACLFVSKS